MSKRRWQSTIDRVGPFPAEFVYALILLLDIAIILTVLTAMLYIGDRIEDVIWPGGAEWTPF